MNNIEKLPTLSGILATWRAVTHQGLMRIQNEDAHLVAHRIIKNEDETALRYLFAIADGLGGHRGGAIASRLALKSVKDNFHNWNGGNINRLVNQCLRNANQKIFETSNCLEFQYNKMQTTLTLVVLEQDSLIVGHVGDCRLYRTRNDHIKLLTEDHTIANELRRLRLISSEQADQHHGRHQLTRSIGGEPFLNIDMIKDQIMVDDTYLLCSDGLWSVLNLEEIKNSMRESDIAIACEKLVGLALGTGAHDNITAIIFRIKTIGKNRYIHNNSSNFLKLFGKFTKDLIKIQS